MPSCLIIVISLQTDLIGVIFFTKPSLNFSFISETHSLLSEGVKVVTGCCDKIKFASARTSPTVIFSHKLPAEFA